MSDDDPLPDGPWLHINPRPTIAGTVGLTVILDWDLFYASPECQAWALRQAERDGTRPDAEYVGDFDFRRAANGVAPEWDWSLDEDERP